MNQKGTDDVAIPINQLVRYNKAIYHNEEIPVDEYTPLTAPQRQRITAEELTQVLKHKYNANKSRGFSRLPPQLLKFLGTTGVSCLATFLTESAIT